MKQQHSNRRLLPKLDHAGLLSKKRNATLGKGLHGYYRVDESTGQVYAEGTASIQSTDDRGWTRKPCLGPNQCIRDETIYHESASASGLDQEGTYSEFTEYMKAPKDYGIKSDRRVRSLKDSSFECVLNNATHLTLEGLQYLPLHLIQLLWDSVNERCLLSFHTWVIFSKLLHQNEGAVLGLFRHRHTIPNPKSPLEMYSSPLTSSSFDFITSLSITAKFPLPDLVRLSKITNLGVLEIIHVPGMESQSDRVEPTPGFVSDRLIRAWHFAALNEGAFKVLRILKLWHFSELSSKSMVYLNGFPALALYDVRGCSFNSSSKIDAKRLGWKATVDENVLDLLESTCVERAIMMQSTLGVESGPPRRVSARQLRDRFKTRRIPRSEIPSFLTRPDAILPRKISGRCFQSDGIEDIGAPSSGTSNPRSWRDLTDLAPQDARTLHKTWEFGTYTSFARIGELRNDNDLARAGVSVGDQVLVQNELVNSVPIVSLRLGRTPPELHTCPSSGRREHSYIKQERARGSPRSLAFIRIKLPPVEAQPGKLPTDSSQQELTHPAQAVIPVPTKHHGISVRTSKKRNIGDMLSSLD